MASNYPSYAFSGNEFKEEEIPKSKPISFRLMMDKKYLSSCFCPFAKLGYIARKSYIMNGEYPSSSCYSSCAFFKECVYTSFLCCVCYPYSPLLAKYIKNARVKYEPFDPLNATSSYSIKEEDIPYYMWPVSLYNHYTFLMKKENDALFKLELEQFDDDAHTTNSSCCCCFSNPQNINNNNINKIFPSDDEKIAEIDLLTKYSSRSSSYNSPRHVSSPKTRIESKVFVFGSTGSGKSLLVQKLVSADITYDKYTIPGALSGTNKRHKSVSHVFPFSNKSSLMHSFHDIDSDNDDEIIDDDNNQTNELLVPNPENTGVFEYDPQDEIKIGVKIVDLTHTKVQVLEVWDIPVACSVSLYMNTFLSEANAFVFVFDASALKLTNTNTSTTSDFVINPSFEKTKLLYEGLVANIQALNEKNNINTTHKQNPTDVYLIASKMDLCYKKLITSTTTKHKKSDDDHVDKQQIANAEDIEKSYNNDSSKNRSDKANSIKSQDNLIHPSHKIDSINDINISGKSLSNLVANRKHNLDIARDWAKSNNIKFIEVSSLKNTGIVELRKSFFVNRN